MSNAIIVICITFLVIEYLYVTVNKEERKKQ